MLQDKHSMLHLTNVIDRATGYVYVQPSSTGPPGTVPPQNADPNSRSQRPNQFALFSTAAGPLQGLRSNVRDVQERWIDAREEWDAVERREWRKEGEAIREAKARETKADSKDKADGGGGTVKSKIRIR